MPEEKTYLELSEVDGSSHKFYEVIVNDTQLTIRYGRIGDLGQTQTKSYPTSDKAKAEASKKIKEKLGKGYEVAILGVRQKRTVDTTPNQQHDFNSKTSPDCVEICFYFCCLWDFYRC